MVEYYVLQFQFLKVVVFPVRTVIVDSGQYTVSCTCLHIPAVTGSFGRLRSC